MTEQKPFPRSKLACGTFSLQNVVSGRGYVANIGYSFVDYALTEEEIAQLRVVICKGCQIQTYKAFDRHAAVGFKDLPSLSLLDRMMFNGQYWRYVAAQDYGYEMAELRKIFRNN